MWRLIATRDFVERVRDGRLYWAGGLMLALLLAAFWVGSSHQRTQAHEQEVARALDYRDWVQQGSRDPHDAAHQGMHAFKREPLLASVDPGINPYIGSTIWLQAHRQSEVKFTPSQDATGLQRFGQLSAGWVLQVLGPLLVIILGFNAFAGEREQGVLRQTLSLGVQPAQLLIGKAAALLGALGVLLLPAALLAGAVLVWSAGPTQRLDVAMRFALLCAGYAVYLCIWIFVVLGTSAASRSARTAITVLLALWVVQAVMAPRVISETSRQLHPSPTRLAFNQALNADLKATSDQVWMRNFGTTERWGADVPLSKWGLALRLDDQAAYPVYDRHFGALWDTWERQQQLQQWTGIAFPLLAIRGFSMAMAGTDFCHHRDFAVSAERHRRPIQDLMSADLVDHADTLDHQHFSYQAESSLWAQVPAFEHRPPGVRWALAGHTAPLLVLLAALVIAVSFSAAMTRRQKAF